MNLYDQLEQMKIDGKKVVSIEYVQRRLVGDQSIRHQTNEKVPTSDFVAGNVNLQVGAYSGSKTG